MPHALPLKSGFERRVSLTGVRIPFAPGGSQLRTSLPLAQMLDGSLTFDGYLGRSLAHPNRSSRLRRRVIASSPQRRIYLCQFPTPTKTPSGCAASPMSRTRPLYHSSCCTHSTVEQ